jgi:catechol 2,3-dioxygenase
MVWPFMIASLELRAVALRVPALEPALDFYVRQLGFTPIGREGASASLATAPDAAPLLTLRADPAAQRPADDAAGLFHAALLLPTRSALGSWLRFAAAGDVDFDGFSDHGVSEALYLTDPFGNGLEFYADRPAAAWPRNAEGLAMTTLPLDWRDLLASASSAGPHPLGGARWGHLHLRVTHLERSEAFYRKHLGLDVTQRSYPGACFLAADGYHHHVAINTWGIPRRPRAPDSLGLVEATFAVAGTSNPPASIVDPDGITLRLIPVA